MSIWNDLSWVESIRTPFLSFFFESITLMGYPTFLILFMSCGLSPLGIFSGPRRGFLELQYCYLFLL